MILTQTAPGLLTCLASLCLLYSCSSETRLEQPVGRPDTRSVPVVLNTVANPANVVHAAAAKNNNLFSENSNFENHSEHWYACEDNPLRTSAVAQDGNLALALNADECVYRSVLVTPGERYTLSCHIKLTDPQPWTGMGLTFADQNEKVLIVSPAAHATSTRYVRLESTATAPQGAHFVSAWLHSEHGALVDSCSLKKAVDNLPADSTSTPLSNSNMLDNPDFSALDGHGGASQWQHGCGGYVTANGSKLVLGAGACVDQSIDASKLSSVSTQKLQFSCDIDAVTGYSDINLFLDDKLVAQRSIDSDEESSRIKTHVNSVNASNGFVSIYSDGELTVNRCELTAGQGDADSNQSNPDPDHPHSSPDDPNTDNQHDHMAHDHLHTTAVTQPDNTLIHDDHASEYVQNDQPPQAPPAADVHTVQCEHVHHWDWNHSHEHDTWQHEHHSESWTQADANNWNWNPQGKHEWHWDLSWDQIWSHNWDWAWQWHQHSHCDQPQLSLEKLGERLFNDTSLSEPRGQSCATCHQRKLAFTDKRQWFPTSLGADSVSFGKRNTPTTMYTSFIPPLGTTQRFNPITQTSNDVPFGGLFIDGRVSSLEEQAKIPFFSTVEMGLSSAVELRDRISLSNYSGDFKAQFGDDIFDNADNTLDAAARAIAAFERTDAFAPFTSKFDQVQTGNANFTESEARGFGLFNGSANCSACHKSPEGIPELFSDLQYHNVGTPRNFDLLNRTGDTEFIDRGHGAVTGHSDDDGLFRTPTLRNVAVTAPYMHNGVFNSLREVLVFYNTREVGFGTEPEVRNTTLPPTFLVGDLGLSDQDINDIVAFLETLTDK